MVGTKRLLVINMTLLSDSVDGAKETAPASGYLQMAVLDSKQITILLVNIYE